LIEKIVDIFAESMRRWIKFGVAEQSWDEYVVSDGNEGKGDQREDFQPCFHSS